MASGSASSTASSITGSASTGATLTRGCPRALCDWKKAKSSGLDGSAMMRWLEDSITSERTSTPSESAGCFSSGVTATSRSLVFVSLASPSRMISGITGEIDDRIDEDRLLRRWRRDFRRRIVLDLRAPEPSVEKRGSRPRPIRSPRRRTRRPGYGVAESRARRSTASTRFARKLRSISCIAVRARWLREGKRSRNHSTRCRPSATGRRVRNRPAGRGGQIVELFGSPHLTPRKAPSGKASSAPDPWYRLP